jgi:hypothetical protein
MSKQSPHTAGSAGTLGRRPSERSRERGRHAWAEVDRELEVRSRLVVALDAIEAGDVRVAELCLLQLLDDLDAAETILERAA